jgi:hypothetical protein
MDLAGRFLKSKFLIKLTHWEYWPFGILQGPALIYWLWLAVKARSLFFFSASNPGILSGGMMGESKADVLEKIPAGLKPKTVLIKLPVKRQTVLDILLENDLSLPLIFKPDIGERGWLVRQIRKEEDIDAYLAEIRIDFIAQELVTLPLEFAVFYYRFPGSDAGVVSSLTAKEFLSVTGDGKKTLSALVHDKPRARLQEEALSKRFREEWHTVIAAGETKELEPIGNHCLGTKFINANHLVTPKLTASFDNISKQIDGFFFGRFDLRCASPEDLEAGNVSIVELNGCGAEPAHIYDPTNSFWSAMADLFAHVRCMYRISVANHQLGVPYLSFAEGKNIYQKFKALRSGQAWTT